LFKREVAGEQIQIQKEQLLFHCGDQRHHSEKIINRRGKENWEKNLEFID